MSANTTISWTDATWNPVVGCERITPGCAKCYAKTLHDRRHKAFLEGKRVAPQYSVPFETVQLMAERLGAPLSWRKPRRVFVNSVSDLFHDDVPDLFIDGVFAVMALCQALCRGHVFQALTKRAARAKAYLTSEPDAAAWADRLAAAAMPLVYGGYEEADCHVGNSIEGLLTPEQNAGWPLRNVWLGVSVENQRWANERIPLLMNTPAAVRWLSCEPLLGPVNLTDVHERLPGGRKVCLINALQRRGANAAHDYLVETLGEKYLAGWGPIDWVVAGGESGPGYRELNLEHGRSLRDQCADAGVPFFMKQDSGPLSGQQGRIPDDLWIQQMPEVR